MTKDLTQADVMCFKAYYDLCSKPLKEKDIQRLADLLGLKEASVFDFDVAITQPWVLLAALRYECTIAKKHGCHDKAALLEQSYLFFLNKIDLQCQ